MAGLLSFALLVGWLAVAVGIAKRMTATVKNFPLRTALMTSLVAVLLALPVADEIIGGFQFRALCKENAVLKIDAKKIKDKTIRVAPEPTEGSRDAEGVAIRIYYYRLSYAIRKWGKSWQATAFIPRVLVGWFGCLVRLADSPVDYPSFDLQSAKRRWPAQRVWF